MRVNNSTYNTKFFDKESMEFIDPLTTGIGKSEFNSASLDAHSRNCLRMSQRPDTYLPVIKKVIPIPPRTTWQIDSTQVRQLDKSTFSTKNPKTLNDLRKIAERLTKKIEHKLAVELSGGLDTAIIIGVLRSIGLDPTLVGAISNRYEFRTERFIQEKIAQNTSYVYFIKEDDSLPFANLKSTPVHPIPNKASLFYYLNKVTASWALESRKKFVLNGIGFDTILIDRISGPAESYFFDPINLDDGWANDYVFSPCGVHYVNVASLHCILKTLITMRSSQTEDSQKLWARNAFESVIPDQLSKYRYKASFGAVYDEGLQRARSHILEMCHVAYDLTRIEELNPSTIAVLINAVRLYDHKAEFTFLARLSYVNWIYQLNRANLIREV
jgi:hypothetical protein